MALRCQGTLLMLADTSGIEREPRSPKKKGFLPSFFGEKKKLEIRDLWVKRKLVLTDESVRFFRPTKLKFDIHDPTPYSVQNACDKLLTRVGTYTRKKLHELLFRYLLVTKLGSVFMHYILQDITNVELRGSSRIR